MEKNENGKAVYEAPTITSMDSGEVLAALGPAQGLSSGVSSPGLGGPDGLNDIVNPGSPRHFGRR